MTISPIKILPIALALACASALAQPGTPVPGYALTEKKAIYDRAALLKQANLPPPVALPVPKNPIALPDDVAQLTIRLTHPPPGPLRIRRVSNNDGLLYLEIYSPAGNLTGEAEILLGAGGYPSGEAQAGGLPDISRWLSEAWRATPPEKCHEKKCIPEGCQIRADPLSGTPPGCGFFYHVSRWCRALTRPQPPAKICQASGLMRHSSSPLNGYGGATATTTLARANLAPAASLWLSLKPRIATLTLAIHAPAPSTHPRAQRADPPPQAALLATRYPLLATFRVPTTLVETRGRQLYLNNEPFLLKGVVVSAPDISAVADYLRTLGINTLRGNNTVANCERHGFMGIISLNSINAPSKVAFYRAPAATFAKESQKLLDKIPVQAAPAIASPNSLILQLGNECSYHSKTDPLPPGVKPLTTHLRRISQMLAAARDILKPLCPMLPLGYANQDLSYLAPDCLDVYMHNTYLARDRYEYPLDHFMRWQGCLPPDGPRAQGRPFVNSEFGANIYLPEAYCGGPNNPALEKLHAWGIRNRWTEFMQHGAIGGAIFNLADHDAPIDNGCAHFGILTTDHKVKLACWEIARLWRDFTIEIAPDGETLRITNRRDYAARDIVLTLTPATENETTNTPAPSLRLPLPDFPPHTTRAIPLKTLALSPAAGGADSTFSPSALQPFSPLSFRWRLDYTTHSGLPAAAAGACPASLEQQDFLALLAKRDTAPFLSELLDAEVLTPDAAPAPPTLAEMTNPQGIIPVILRKPNGVAYLVPIVREDPNTPAGPVKQNLTLDIALKGRVEQVDDMTGQPLSAPADAPSIDATPTAAGQRLNNLQAARIPANYGDRSKTPFTMPVYRITPP